MRRRTFLKKSAAGIGALAGGALSEEIAFSRHPALAAAFASSEPNQDGQPGPPAWGINAAILRTPWNGVPTADELIADREHTLVFDRFYRVGGESTPATPTECRLAYNSHSLFILWRCTESDMSFPYANLNPNWWKDANWHFLPGLPSGPPAIWPPYPDEVDILIQPAPERPSYYQFAATLQGMKFGRSYLWSGANAAPDEQAYSFSSSETGSRTQEFTAEVIRRATEWLVLFQIPWRTLGGKPKSHFGFLPMRTRWRGGEFSSPVALAVNECLPVDLLIETHFNGPAYVEDSQCHLCRLPSGVLRWQRPALKTHADRAICARIWQMQLSLDTPTNQKNLKERLLLVQHWMDMMRQEGFVPIPSASEVLVPNLTLALFRQKVNAAFRARDFRAAYKLLDSYLDEVDKVSRWWYVDGSPGNILKEQWTPVSRILQLEVQHSVLQMRCLAGNHEVNLHIGVLDTGGIRLYGETEGYWRPDRMLPLTPKIASNSCAVETGAGRILIRENPFSISFYDAAGRQVTQIAANDLAFRFDQNNRILGVDFRCNLDPHEVIYGFGERYDAFNESGKIFTLWGTDGWIDHFTGPANTTYKPVPVFHSSNGYMAFDNSSYRLRVDAGKTTPGRLRLTQHGPIFDYYFWIGTPQSCLESYTALTGRPALPPKWAFEPWIGRGGNAWASGRLHNALAEQESAVRRYTELDIPHSAIYAEGPLEDLSYLSPALCNSMAAQGIRVLGYFKPVIGPAQQQLLMPEVGPTQLPILHCGRPELTKKVAYVDFTNPNAKELCRRFFEPLLELGEAGSMVDYGDITPDSARFYEGQNGAEMHNFYYYDYQRTVSEVFQEKRGNDFVLFARGAAPGTQRWTGQFAGDHPTNFEGLKYVLTGALNLCACGYSTWGSDIGGYFGFPQPAVLMRWYQLGCFSPLMRCHGLTPREPWYFGEQAVAHVKYLSWLRMNLLDYIYNAAAAAQERGIPIMRSMPIAFPDEPGMAAISDQYMFGPDLLVAPVIHEGIGRKVTFPSGVWTSLWDGKKISGPAEVHVSAPLETIPVFLRPGAVVAVQMDPALQFGASTSRAHVNALILTIPNGSDDRVLMNARGKVARVNMQPAMDGICWQVKNLPEVDYLLIYGIASASSVEVDGVVWKETKMASPEEISAGWLADRASNRLIIRLPLRERIISEPQVRIKLIL